MQGFEPRTYHGTKCFSGKEVTFIMSTLGKKTVEDLNVKGRNVLAVSYTHLDVYKRQAMCRWLRASWLKW